MVSILFMIEVLLFVLIRFKLCALAAGDIVYSAADIACLVGQNNRGNRKCKHAKTSLYHEKSLQEFKLSMDLHTVELPGRAEAVVVDDLAVADVHAGDALHLFLR